MTEMITKFFNQERRKRNGYFLISGPCVIEDESLVAKTAERLVEITSALKIDFIFKASFDKANRSSSQSFRGVGIEKGLQILESSSFIFCQNNISD